MNCAWRCQEERKRRTRELISRYAHDSYVNREDLNVGTACDGRHTHGHQNAFVSQGKTFHSSAFFKTETEEQHRD